MPNTLRFQEKIFALNFDNNKIIESPNIDAEISGQIQVLDIDFDEKLEVIIPNKSVKIQGNGNQSQLIILNNKLEYKFEPVNFHGAASQISLSICSTTDSIFIACLNSGMNENEVFNNLMLYQLTLFEEMKEKLSQIQI